MELFLELYLLELSQLIDEICKPTLFKFKVKIWQNKLFQINYWRSITQTLQPFTLNIFYSNLQKLK